MYERLDIGQIDGYGEAVEMVLDMLTDDSSADCLPVDAQAYNSVIKKFDAQGLSPKESSALLLHAVNIAGRANYQLHHINPEDLS